MSSNAFSVHLVELLQDTEELQASHSQLKTGNPGRQYGLAALNRAVVVMSISAWEAYVEELVRESLIAIRPPQPPLGVWSALYASSLGQLGRFNTPDAAQVKDLLSQTLGLADIHIAWRWQNCSSQQAIKRLAEAMKYRHQIAHGVNPRPRVINSYSRELRGFILRLALATDDAVRDHLVNVLGVANPWPL